FLVNNWTRTVSKPTSGQPMNKIGVAGSIDVNIYNNTAVATIGAGARINQNPLFQTPAQSVDVAAETYIDEINITGMFDVTLSPDGAAKAIRKRTLPAGNGKGNPLASEQLFSLLGNRSGGVGIGISAPITVVVNTPTARIDSAALVHVGASGSLAVTAND